MLLCGHCNTGWHWGCLDPPLTALPAGTWSCPECRVLPLAGQVAPTEAPPPSADQVAPPEVPPPAEPCVGKLLFPRASTRRLDEEAEGLNGREVQQLESGGRKGPVVVRHGTLQFRGAIARPRYFTVRWSTGEEEELTLTRARRLLSGTEQGG